MFTQLSILPASPGNEISLFPGWYLLSCICIDMELPTERSQLGASFVEDEGE